MFDLLFVGGQVVDGLGTPMYPADVGVSEGKIAAVGRLNGAEAARTIDCTGRCVSPGWVDIHGHADWSALNHPIGLNLLIQGCTLTVAGNCGGAPAPMAGRASEMLKQGRMRSLGSPTARPVGGVSFAPQLDVTEDADTVTVSIELPGVPEEDLEVSFANGILSIRGEKRLEAEEAARHYALRECEFGRFERAIAIGPEVDAEAIEASCRNGVLRVVLPKTERARTAIRRIPIEAR